MVTRTVSALGSERIVRMLVWADLTIAGHSLGTSTKQLAKCACI